MNKYEVLKAMIIAYVLGFVGGVLLTLIAR